MDEIPGTTPTEQPAQARDDSLPIQPAVVEPAGFGARGRARRRARFLRRARELAYRDLGGLVFNLHRFGQRNDALVLAKLSTLGHIDSELRAIETALQERQPVTVLREAGITACPRCAAIHGSEDRFCPNCGLPMTPHADLPIAGAPAGAEQPGSQFQPAAPTAPATAAVQTPTPAPSTQAYTAPQSAEALATAAPAPGVEPAAPDKPAARRKPKPKPRSKRPGPENGGGPAAEGESTEIIHPRAPGA